MDDGAAGPPLEATEVLPEEDEFGIDAASRELGVRSFAGYLACELEELRKGYGSGGTAPLSGDVMPIAMHFVSTMAKNHMRDNPRR